MSKLTTPLVLSVLWLGACATTTPPLDRTVTVSTRVGAQITSTKVLPAAQSPTLPSADSLPDRYLSRLGDHASVELELCIAPDGKVASIDLVRGTQLAMFDAAVMHDVASWRFAATPDATCQRTMIVYRPTA